MKHKTQHETNLEAIKNAHNYEAFAREDIQKYAEEKKLGVDEVVMQIVNTLKERCPYNFFGCNDSEGNRVAFNLDEIGEAFGIEHPTCQEVCEHGCCAYINQILVAIGLTAHKGEDNEA